MNKDKNAPLKVAMLGHKTVPAMDSSQNGIEVMVDCEITRPTEEKADYSTLSVAD